MNERKLQKGKMIAGRRRNEWQEEEVRKRKEEMKRRTELYLWDESKKTEMEKRKKESRGRRGRGRGMQESIIRQLWESSNGGDLILEDSTAWRSNIQYGCTSDSGLEGQEIGWGEQVIMKFLPRSIFGNGVS